MILRGHRSLWTFEYLVTWIVSPQFGHTHRNVGGAVPVSPEYGQVVLRTTVIEITSNRINNGSV